MSLDRLRSLVFGRDRETRYWEKRAAKFGARAVFNLGHSAAELASITAGQQQVLFRLLREQLRGDESLVLDFGCGTGRFTAGLADVIGGRAIGVDPIQRFLDLAPVNGRVEYRVIRDGRIPIANGQVDVVWVCLVLGTIVRKTALTTAVAEIERVLAPGGLLFVVENTAPRRSMRHFHFRSPSFYASLFPRVPLQPVGEYDDLGERITAFAGRKPAA